MEKLKGNITVEEGQRDVTTLGGSNNPQVCVTKTFTLKGVDLSEYLTSSNWESDDDASIAASEAVDEAKAALEKSFAEQKETSTEELTNDPNFVGFNATVSIYNIEMPDDLKSCEIQLEVHSYYDTPVSKLERAVEDVAKSIIGK